MAKRFALFSFGVLCLMVSALIGFHMGSQSAIAQASGNIAGFASFMDAEYVILDNGDVYVNKSRNAPVQYPPYADPATYVGNFFTGEMGTVPTSPETWGGVKGKFDGEQ